MRLTPASATTHSSRAARRLSGFGRRRREFACAGAADALRGVCRGSRVVSFPRPLWPLVTQDVLVETWQPGHIVRDFVYSDSIYNRKIAQIGLQAYLQMMLVVLPPSLPPALPSSPPRGSRVHA